MTLDFRGRIHLSLTAQSRSHVSQVRILHISAHLVSLCHQGTERGRMRHLDASLSLSTECRGSLSNYLWSPKFCLAIVIKDESQSMLFLHFFKESLWICWMTSSLLNTGSLLPTRSFCDVCLFAILPDSFRVHCKITWPVVSWIQEKQKIHQHNQCRHIQNRLS